MARCSCSGGTCACLIQAADPSVTITGAGSVTNPYQISATGNLSGALKVQDTQTVNMTLIGNGSPTDPFTISADVTMRMRDLSDVDHNDVPVVGDVPVYDGTKFTFAPPPTVPPGTVNVGAGLTGDGSAGAAIKLDVTDTWASTPGLAPWASGAVGDLDGNPTYIDSAGNVRTRPQVIQPSPAWSSTNTLIGNYPTGLSIMTLSTADATAGGWPGAGMVVTEKRFGDDLATQWWYSNSLTVPDARWRVGSTTNWAAWTKMVPNAPSAWTTVTVPNGQMRYRVQGVLVQLQVDVAMTTVAGTIYDLNTAALLPAAIIPSFTCRGYADYSGFPGGLSVNTSGTVSARHNSGANRSNISGSVTYALP